jgi:hypothetical protein
MAHGSPMGGGDEEVGSGSDWERVGGVGMCFTHQIRLWLQTWCRSSLRTSGGGEEPRREGLIRFGTDSPFSVVITMPA